MNIDLQRKEIHGLLPTDILFQTAYWSQVKSLLGWKPAVFDFKSSMGQRGDLLALIRPLSDDLAFAYVPQGPESGPDPEQYGLFLEALSEALAGHLDPAVVFIRYDLPWESPYPADAANGQSGPGRPVPQLRELRLNIGTRNWNLRKAAVDLTVADAWVVDLGDAEETVFGAMKPKTRYNVRLAQRKGVRVFCAASEMLPVFYDLYLQTARRNGFLAASYRHFAGMFSPLALERGSVEILLLLASRGRDILAGAIVAISQRRAFYLYGASSGENRNLMAPYALHWEAMKLACERGCLAYDMGAVSPGADPRHPFYGMYRFKAGFGGNMVHRKGSWDYPLDRRGYKAFRNFEGRVQSGLPYSRERS